MDAILLRWEPVDDAQAYRLMVHDRTDGETIFDETVPAPGHRVPVVAERRSHDLVMRVRARCSEGWRGWSEYRPLPLEVVLGDRRDPKPQLQDHDSALCLVFTVDTECSVARQPNPDPDRVVDELIFGNFVNSDRPGGIGLHMDLLEHFGFRGCFFVDVLMEYRYGQRALERTIEAIVERGHEVELHVHADHLGRSSDPRIAELEWALLSGDSAQFRRVLELSVDLFERRVGRRPIAYRAGGYRIADAHFPVLEELGIRIDSSVQPFVNSRVSDWMWTRTQPFWVGGVLEIPPTTVLLNDHPGNWGVRSLAGSVAFGDTVSGLPAAPSGAPHVATLVSHSFELLKRNTTRDPRRVAAFAEQLRYVVPADVGDRLLRRMRGVVRTFGEDVDDGVVASIAGVLRRVADRPDARCVTYGEIAAAADRYWPSERHPPVDPISLLNRQSRTSEATGARVYSRGLLSHLASSVPVRRARSERRDRTLLDGLECCGATQLRDRLADALADSGSAEPIRARFRTLGVAPPELRGRLPPLAELLFPQTELLTVADVLGASIDAVFAWDVTTFRSWLMRQGFEIVGEQRVPRHRDDLTAIDTFAGKLRWLDPLELRTEAVEVEVRDGTLGAAQHDPAPAQTFEAVTNDPLQPAAMPAAVDPMLLPKIATELYESLYTGQKLRMRLAAEPLLASRTTVLLALMRAGLEVLDGDETGYLLIRPVELFDLKRIAGT